MERVNAAYPGKVRWVFRQFPLELHEHAQAAAEASLCADEQGKFWPYHDALFQKPGRLERDDLRESAGAVGLDVRKFSQCLESRHTEAQVREDVSAGQAAGVSAPPALFINGVMLSGARPLEDLKKVIDEQLGAN
jgi:protein-disulfide isomerase